MYQKIYWYRTRYRKWPMKRPRIDTSDDVVEEVHSYAKENGLSIPRAWGQLVENALESQDHD